MVEYHATLEWSPYNATLIGVCESYESAIRALEKFIEHNNFYKPGENCTLVITMLISEKE